MYSKFLFIIPARSGSKGIADKNIKTFCGKPLMAWTIEEAKKSKYCHTLALSSDSDTYLAIGQEYGCDHLVKRPESLSTDRATTIAVIEHVVEEVPGYDYIVLLQPTSPLRLAADIDGAIESMLVKEASSCVSIYQSAESAYWMYKTTPSGQIEKLLKQEDSHYQRQSLPNTYSLNGAVYVKEIAELKREKAIINEQTVGYIMPVNRSYDIDTYDDWLIAEMFHKRKEEKYIE